MINHNTQAGRLLLHLEAGKAINRLSALVELGIFELSARIIDLESHGFKIHKERKTVTNRFDEKTSVTEYSLEKERMAA
ncbi:MAG: helix-turn-helix domain-containing protein [Pseudomonadota bacterium]